MGLDGRSISVHSLWSLPELSLAGRRTCTSAPKFDNSPASRARVKETPLISGGKVSVSKLTLRCFAFKTGGKPRALRCKGKSGWTHSPSHIRALEIVFVAMTPLVSFILGNLTLILCQSLVVIVTTWHMKSKKVGGAFSQANTWVQSLGHFHLRQNSDLSIVTALGRFRWRKRDSFWYSLWAFK